jgi:hypothetical protein
MITTSATSQIWKKKKHWLGHLKFVFYFSILAEMVIVCKRILPNMGKK